MIMKNKSFCFFFLFCILVACDRPETVESDPAAWPATTTTTRPWTRWWWMGNAVDTAGLNGQLEELAKAGIGGVEISPIYGVKGFEEQFLEHLSPAWIDMLDHAIHKAGALGMQVDMIQGTGWPFGGPQVGPSWAASRLFVQKYWLEGGQSLEQPIEITQGRQTGFATLEAVLAFDHSQRMIELMEQVDHEGGLEWTAPDGNWVIYAVFCGKTLQRVKRPAPGGAGWVLDHFSREALQGYTAPYDTLLQSLEKPPRALFNDSYEVGGADWTPGFFAHFQEKRGYDLRPLLPYLLSDEQNDTVARVKSDYRETLSDLLLEDFTRPWAVWAHEHDVLIKNQAHGSPGNLLDLYAAADIPECESFSVTPFDIPGLRRDTTKTQWEDPDPIMIQFAASAAHVAGRPLTSAESMTWLGDHFQVALSQCKPEIEQLFLSGVNHVFFHGTTYSPRDEAWPGWKFYASTHFAPHNTIWRDAPAFFEYINRVQSVLQAGQPDNELLVYWPVYDIWADTGHGSLLQQLTIHRISEWLLPSPFYQEVRKLMDAGYSVDFISDRQLLGAGIGEEGIELPGGSYRALIVPDAKYMPLATFEHLLELAKQGGEVLMADLPEDVPGWENLEDRRDRFRETKNVLEMQSQAGERAIDWGQGRVHMGENMIQSLESIGMQGEKLSSFGLKFIRRKWSAGHYYYIVNHTTRPVDAFAPLATTVRSAVLMDPQSGRTGLAELAKQKETPEIRLQLRPGEAMVIRTYAEQDVNVPLWQYEDEGGSGEISMEGPWRVQFLEGGPALPSPGEVSELTSWTEWGTDEKNFSGTALYQTTFPMPAQIADEYILDLGLVRESARVRLNGEEVGVAWSIPYRLRLDGRLLREENMLEIEVTNLGANRIRYMDREGIEWKKFYDINIVHKSYRPFDASNWPDMPSGLLGPITLTPLERKEQ